MQPTAQWAKAKRHSVTAESAWMVPLICICGHADHGKTTLLSALGGGARVWLKDSKGMTQVLSRSRCRVLFVALIVRSIQGIHNYEMEIGPAGATCLASFIDTPGQAAFEKMRQVWPYPPWCILVCARVCARVCVCLRACGIPGQRQFLSPSGRSDRFRVCRTLHTWHDRSCARQASLFGADLALLVVALNTGHRQPLPLLIASPSSMRMHILPSRTHVRVPMRARGTHECRRRGTDDRVCTHTGRAPHPNRRTQSATSALPCVTRP